jgi:hypothetical protein
MDPLTLDLADEDAPIRISERSNAHRAQLRRIDASATLTPTIGANVRFVELGFGSLGGHARP